ncbi:hemin uptake protein HemP [Sinimarinibacterium sp. NLF-5-8]|uniref:hemin uptake protein HemP n=1 Tax=Sinimarinibacterium sp. NLF-5-8 TaxID=2698684 RepID=UPI00137C06E9|nr:hemin uptake protein HemP [Sinimarinibacterium sp. NLF-5-8]QHS10944.1 hemin uptake protein HemP [Sinimarinibacterium sp. NLF-5-8]
MPSFVSDVVRVQAPAPLAAKGVVDAVDALEVIRSETLFARDSRVLIQHGMALYCLRLTRNNRLILTKP